jgi:hypothetical protein
VTPVQLADCLRRPLGELAALAGDDHCGEISAVVLLARVSNDHGFLRPTWLTAR